MYLAYLIYIGDGVVDFNEVWSEAQSLFYYVCLQLKLL